MQIQQKAIINSSKEKDKNKNKDNNNNNNNPLFDRNVDLITAGLSAGYARALRNEISQDNALIICDCILSMNTEINLSYNYRKSNIDRLVKFSKFHNHKPFRQISREEALAFLDNLRKPESLDPMHKWIGTYNTYRIQLIRFFKWLYYPVIELIIT
jgi:hypothetical protein